MVPEPPTNVRAVHGDGTTTALEVAYVGMDDKGIHHWATTQPIDIQSGIQVTMDRLPAHTAVDVIAG
jgi:hypothetical protein